MGPCAGPGPASLAAGGRGRPEAPGVAAMGPRRRGDSRSPAPLPGGESAGPGLPGSLQTQGADYRVSSPPTPQPFQNPAPSPGVGLALSCLVSPHPAALVPTGPRPLPCAGAGKGRAAWPQPPCLAATTQDPVPPIPCPCPRQTTRPQHACTPPPQVPGPRSWA